MFANNRPPVANREKVPAAFFLALTPHTYAAVAAGKNFDLAQPRNSLENCEKDTGLDKKVSPFSLWMAQPSASHALSGERRWMSRHARFLSLEILLQTPLKYLFR